MTDEKLDRIVETLQQVNVHLEGMRVSLHLLTQACDDHEKRLRLVERWRNNLTPILAAITFLLGAILTATLNRLI